MIAVEIVILLGVVVIGVWALYALLRPFTHTHYRHTSERLWRPLD